MAHAGVPEVAEQIHQEVVSRYQPRDTYVSDVTAALGVHVGLGAWGIFWQIEDAAPSDTAEPFPANPGPQA